MQLTAVVLAGSRPGPDAFAEAHGTDLKALIAVSGKPMVCWPVEALLRHEGIGTIHVLAQQPERLRPVLPDDPRLVLRRSRETIAATLDEICGDPATSWPLLITTADHVLLDRGMIDDFSSRAAGADVAIAVVERRALLARLPQTRRTWIGFRGGAYSGANLFALAGPQAAAALSLWRGVEQERKKGWKLLAALGFHGLLGLLRLRTLDATVAAIGRRLGVTIRAVAMHNPLAAVDVDKPDDHALVEAIVESHEGRA